MFGSHPSLAAAATSFGAVAAALVITAPAAPATVNAVGVAPGLSFGSSTAFGTGCSYIATATAAPGDVVGFFDPLATFDPGGWITVPSSGTVTAKWTPLVPGEHTIFAVGNDAAFVSTKATVGAGVNLGFVCLVLP
ncbi:hypothetical protein F5X71_18425 [Nocardia brasiliensis]|uniref:Ig-like domain repeat protein n=1 Tax=Nocardia brasiliensis TaxID=37326 RepID=A0A6G9XT05_NOCBR|nr:hypothetical protein [Nocardia brasiliensis]QIS04038.1 hypothetical protein F5X71_18425 [Nocardia brasiliensis]